MNIYLAIIITIAAILLLFGGSKIAVFLKGLYHIFFKNLAETPEGAETIYAQAIDEAQDKYSQASNTLANISGALADAKRKKEKSEKELTDLESQCKQLIKSGNESAALVLANGRQGLIDLVNNYTINISGLEANVKDAKEILSICESNLKQLQSEKTTVVENLKLDLQLKKSYNSLDELRKDNGVAKLLGQVREGADQKRNEAVGARIVHENKASTQIAAAQKLVNQSSANDFLDSLKADMNKEKK